MSERFPTCIAARFLLDYGDAPVAGTTTVRVLLGRSPEQRERREEQHRPHLQQKISACVLCVDEGAVGRPGPTVPFRLFCAPPRSSSTAET